MTNFKIIGIVIAAIVIAVSVFAISGVDKSTNNTETEPLNDSVIAISDSVILEKNTVESDNNPDYYIDEEGVKRFVISATDSPNIDD